MSEIDQVYRVMNIVIRPKLILQDGTTISVQASSGHYCIPRDNDGPYSHVEVGFPSVRPEPWSEWSQYAEEPSEPTETVYGCVPIGLVLDFIKAHGSDVIEATERLELL